MQLTKREAVRNCDHCHQQWQSQCGAQIENPEQVALDHAEVYKTKWSTADSVRGKFVIDREATDCFVSVCFMGTRSLPQKIRRSVLGRPLHPIGHAQRTPGHSPEVISHCQTEYR